MHDTFRAVHAGEAEGMHDSMYNNGPPPYYKASCLSYTSDLCSV